MDGNEKLHIDKCKEIVIELMIPAECLHHFPWQYICEDLSAFLIDTF